MDNRLKLFFADVVTASEAIISNPATNVPDLEIDLVKVEACISLLEALKSAINQADEAKKLASSDLIADKSWMQEVLSYYAKDQVNVAMNLNAIKANVEEVGR